MSHRLIIYACDPGLDSSQSIDCITELKQYLRLVRTRDLHVIECDALERALPF